MKNDTACNLFKKIPTILYKVHEVQGFSDDTSF